MDEILVVQHVGRSGEVMDGTKLDPVYALETLADVKIHPNAVARISRDAALIW